MEISMEQLIEHLLAELGDAGQILSHQVFAPRGARYAECGLPAEVERCVRSLGIEQLYTHQVSAIEAVRRGEDLSRGIIGKVDLASIRGYHYPASRTRSSVG